MADNCSGSVVLYRSFRFVLAPTAEQARALAKTVGAARFVYNLCLEQRRDFWRQYRRQMGRPISYFGQTIEITELRREVDWLAAVPRDALDQAAHDVQRAYDRFFSGAASYPNFRKRSDGCGFSLRGRDISVRRLNAKWAEVRLQTLGWIKFRLTREMRGIQKIVSVREERGQWFISLANEIEHDAVVCPTAAVGIDRGVANTLALSTGEMFRMPPAIQAIDRRRRKAQRVLARRVRGSKRRDKARARVAALHARARRMRADWLHRTTADISRRFGHIAIEALNVRSMTASAAGTVEAPGTNVAQKRGLNRSILAQGWGEFERQLTYKVESTGGTLIRVPAHYTSQTCQSCGAVDARNRESQAIFRCVHCGHEAHADTNAALEILRRSTAPMLAEGTRRRSAEARTSEIAA